MELGDLELAVLGAVRTLKVANSGAIFHEVRKIRDVAYTSVTTTLYRLVEKDLVTVRRESEKKVYYSVKGGRAYKKAMASMIDRVVDTFGGAAVSYILENPEGLSEEQFAALREQVQRHRAKEKSDG